MRQHAVLALQAIWLAAVADVVLSPASALTWKSAETAGHQSPAAPKEPSAAGCYVWLPMGCPQQPSFEATSWTVDAYWRMHKEKVLTKEGCEQQRGPHFAHWCGVGEAEVRMLYVDGAGAGGAGAPRQDQQATSPQQPRNPEPKAPKRPGCYTFAPFGCPNHPSMPPASWFKDNWHDAATNRTTCEVVRPRLLAPWCGAPEMKMLFVEDTGERPTPGDEFWDLRLEMEAERVAKASTRKAPVEQETPSSGQLNVKGPPPSKHFPLDVPVRLPARMPLVPGRKYEDGRIDQLAAPRRSHTSAIRPPARDPAAEAEAAALPPPKAAAPQPAAASPAWTAPNGVQKRQVEAKDLPPREAAASTPPAVAAPPPPAASPTWPRSSQNPQGELLPTLPSESGCYVYTSLGCPSHPVFADAARQAWVRDLYGEKHLDADVDRATCYRRGSHFEEWCGVAEVRMAFVPPMPGKVARREPAAQDHRHAAEVQKLQSDLAAARRSFEEVAQENEELAATMQAMNPLSPTEPGCYVFTPKGCPKHPTFEEVSKSGWVRDTFGEKYLGAGSDARVCNSRGRTHFEEWCGTQEVRIAWVMSHDDGKQLLEPQGGVHSQPPGKQMMEPQGEFYTPLQEKRVLEPIGGFPVQPQEKQVLEPQGVFPMQPQEKQVVEPQGRFPMQPQEKPSGEGSAVERVRQLLEHAAGLQPPPAPRQPGCFVWTPLGCPRNPLLNATASWVHDVVVDGLNDRVLCETKRRQVFKDWCSADDVRMLYIPVDAPILAHSHPAATQT